MDYDNIDNLTDDQIDEQIMNLIINESVNESVNDDKIIIFYRIIICFPNFIINFECFLI